MDEKQPKFTVPTRRMIVLGIILLSCVGAYVGEDQTLLLAIGGLLALIKGDD
jgi:hypothetical protein